MTIQEAIEILEAHNRWRRGDHEIGQGDANRIGKAIDLVCSLLSLPDGWKNHCLGDPMPVGDEDLVEVKLKNGKEFSALPASFWGLPGQFFSMWEALPESPDAEIVAWRRPKMSSTLIEYLLNKRNRLGTRNDQLAKSITDAKQEIEELEEKLDEARAKIEELEAANFQLNAKEDAQ